MAVATIGDGLLKSDSRFQRSGVFLLVAAETGSAKHHSYDYRLYRVSESGDLEPVDDSEIDDRLDKARLNDACRAGVRNSEIYRLGVYCYLCLSKLEAPAPAPEELTAAERTRVEQLKALPPERRALVTAQSGR